MFILNSQINRIFGKVKGDVKVNSATLIAMSCCNETIHKTYSRPATKDYLSIKFHERHFLVQLGTYVEVKL